MQRIMSRIATRIAKLEDITAGHGHGHGHDSIGTSTATAAHSRTGGGNQNPQPHAQHPADRPRPHAVHRAESAAQRLAKITKHAAFYLDQSQADESKKFDLLSESEAQFLRNHQALLAGFYGASFLNTFPAGLRKLDDRSWGVSMAEGPEGASSVFVQCLAGEVEERGGGG
jgi:hypothetical protein